MRLTTDRTIVLKDRRTLGFAEYDDPQGIPMLLFHGAPGSRLEGHSLTVPRKHTTRGSSLPIFQVMQPLQLYAMTACWATWKIVSPWWMRSILTHS